jgi:hypothetical protein
MFITRMDVSDGKCSAGDHCLALECPLNHTEHEHLVHMLDMSQDEPVDKETARMWGKDTAVGCLVEMARRFSTSLKAAESQKEENTEL